MLVDTDRQGKVDLIRLLKRYRLRLKISIDDVSDTHSVWVRFGTSSTDSSAVGGLWPADPRLAALGMRTVLPNEQAPSSSSSSSSSSSTSASPWTEYQRWRVLQGVAEGDSEIPTGGWLLPGGMAVIPKPRAAGMCERAL